MASALDRLLKKYTLEDSGSGVGSTGRKKLPLYPSDTTPAVTLPTPAAADPYADIRNLDILDMRQRMTQRAAGYVDSGDGQTWQDARYEFTDPNDFNSFDYARYGDPSQTGLAFGGLPQQYQSKYGAIKDAGNGRIVVTMQQPGAHKYDTMDAYYKQDPASGKWVMDGNPVNTRQVSSRENWKDTIEPIAALAALAGTAYLGGTYLAAAEGGGAAAGAAGGSGAGAGAADTYMLGAANAAVPAATDTYMLGAAGGAGAGAGASDAYMAGAAGAGAGGGSGAGAAAGSAASGLTSTPSSGTVSTPSASGSWLDDIAKWMKDPKNAEVAKLLFGATGAVLGGTGGSSGGGYSYSGPMPTISRQGWSPTAQQQTMLGGPSMGMLDVKPGEAMSGLWRYGLLGGGGK